MIVIKLMGWLEFKRNLVRDIKILICKILKTYNFLLITTKNKKCKNIKL